MRRALTIVSLAALAVVMSPLPSAAQQSLNLYVGGFVPRGLDARDEGDVLLNNLQRGDYSFDFNFDDFKNATVGADWLIALGRHLEAGIGVGYYRKTVESSYAFLLDQDGTLIDQDLRLRIAPLSATIRVLPLGRYATVQPYIGAGVGVLFWRYSEIGEFVGTDDLGDFVFQDRFSGSGSEVSPVILGGLRVPLGNWDLGFELRHQQAEAELPESDFLDPVIDLGGMNYLVTFNIRF